MELFPCYDCENMGDETPRCSDYLACDKWKRWFDDCISKKEENSTLVNSTNLEYSPEFIEPLLEVFRETEDRKILEAFNNGEWCDTADICRLLSVSFAEGMHQFEFSRSAQWNPCPMNGQKIVTKFRIKSNGGIK